MRLPASGAPAAVKRRAVDSVHILKILPFISIPVVFIETILKKVRVKLFL
jgi:hypothetical protein